MTDIDAARAKRWWLGGRPIGSIERAAAYIDDLGFALLFPKRGIRLPALWDAACARPLRNDDGRWEWGADAERLWGWKDELPLRGMAWYGRFIRGRPSFLSKEMLAMLYPRSGTPDDFTEAPISREALRIATVLRRGPLPSPLVRQAVGLDGKSGNAAFTQAITELGRALVVTHYGTEQLEGTWPSSVLELTARAFRVGGRHNKAEAAGRFLDTVLVARPLDLGNAFGWGAAAAREVLEELVATGTAARDGRAYRAVTPARSSARSRARPARSSARGAVARAARP